MSAVGQPGAPLPGVRASRSELIALRARVSAGWRRAGPPASGAGERPAPRLGRGMEFAEVRPYQPGDDVRSLDWRHTARRGRPYTKLFHEEGEWTVQLLVDQGASMQFGTRVAFKAVQAARAAALLAWAAGAAGDRLGGIAWDGRQIGQARPQPRERGTLELLRLLTPEVLPEPGALSLALPLQALTKWARHGTQAVLVSDFHSLDAAAEAALASLRQRAAVALLHVYDSFEATPPPPGLYRVSDGAAERLLDLRGPAARAAHGAALRARRERLAGLARRFGMPLLELATHDDPILALRALSGPASHLYGSAT